MGSLEMEGPYSLNRETINSVVDNGRIRNYALGRGNDKGDLSVRYVGRSDSDAKARLLQHIGEGYRDFKFTYSSSKKLHLRKNAKTIMILEGIKENWTMNTILINPKEHTGSVLFVENDLLKSYRSI